MLNQKGQAFDAFKLLIAAVVAGAILVILLSMIGGFIQPGQDPVTVMAQELNKVKKGGVASTSKAVVQFSEGDEFSSDAIATAAGLNRGSLEFCCSGAEDSDGKCENYAFDDLTSGVEAFICDGPNTVIVDQDIAGKIRAYCPLNEDKCIIGFRQARS